MKAKIYETACAKDFVVLSSALSRFDAPEFAVFPGFCDVHVHFREPGFSYKETIKTGAQAAARGGYTAVCTMPNLNPVPDSVEHLNLQRAIIERDACIHVYPYGAITVGEKGETLADIEGMAPFVCGFSDDGRGVQRDDMMKEAMIRAKAQGKMIVAHCEVNDLLRGGYIHDGEYARQHGHRGICSESEWAQIARDIELIRETGCAYHVCHISTKESVDIIRKAKAEGLDITCETGPHYLVMNDTMLHLKMGAHCVIVQAAWPAARVADWELLLRARALENRGYVIGCNCIGPLRPTRHTHRKTTQHLPRPPIRLHHP